MPSEVMFASPLDSPAATADQAPPLVQLGYHREPRLVPSRFNAQTVGEDGRLMLWNTLSGSISVFKAVDRDRVLSCLKSKRKPPPSKTITDYLRRRGYLVPEEMDEMAAFRYRYAREQWRTDTLQLTLLASEDCNFRCVYCYEKFKNGTMSPDTRQGVKTLVMQRAPQLENLHISWFGGEPLYGWEAVEELSPFFKDVAEKYDLRFAQSMTTNAYLLTEERATRLLDWGVRRYQITIDGLAGEHDCKRVGRDGSPTYDVILDNLRSLHQRTDVHYEVAIRVNFDNENFPYLGPFIEYLSEEFGGDSRFLLRFRAVGQWGGERDDELDVCGLKDKRKIVNDLQTLSHEKNLRFDGGISAISQFGSQVCYAARPYHFVIGAKGTVMKCTVALDEMKENVVGQLTSDGTLQLDDERMGLWVNPYFEHDALCQKCYVLPGCQGVSCPLTRLTINQRSCCAVKSSLKSEMRHTLETASGRSATVSN